MFVKVEQPSQALAKFLKHKFIKFTTTVAAAAASAATTTNVILSHYTPLHFGVFFNAAINIQNRVWK